MSSASHSVGGPVISYCGKRVLDIAVAGAACVALAPLVAGVAGLVWLEDRGEPWFVQTRMGRERQPFLILKLRSMRDLEVTRVGHWLRRTGLDELPQFLNVLRGDMSVVGPRPLTQHDIERLGWNVEQHDWRFAVRPGITGLSQLLGGAGARAGRRFDRLYLRKQSALLDVKLIALSFGANVFGKRAVRQWLRGR